MLFVGIGLKGDIEKEEGSAVDKNILGGVLCVVKIDLYGV
jgi:hypothetical protein